MFRLRPVLLFNLALTSLLPAPACVDLLGGEGQACSADGRCGLGLFCEHNVCRRAVSTAGGASAPRGQTSSESVGGSAGESSDAVGGSSSAEGGGMAAGGKGAGGKTESGGSSSDAVGGAQASGGAPGGGGETSGGGSREAGGTSSGGASLGPNLLENGDFAAGSEHWKLEGGNGTFQGVREGAFCIESEADVDFGLSAPGQNEEPFALESSTTYLLSYRVRGALSWTAKVGLSESPYTAFGEWQESTSQTSSFQSFVHTFHSEEGSERVGFIFQGRGRGEFCFDDVVIARSE